MTYPEEADAHDPLASYAEVTPERLALAHLQSAASQLSQACRDPLFLFLAARSVQLALLSALTSAVAGSSSTGAYPPEKRAEWNAYFERRDPGEAAPEGDRVMSFRELLAEATARRVGWLEAPLNLSSDEREQINRLTNLRDWTEHPRPRSHYIDPLWILPPLRAGLVLAEQCLQAVMHRLEIEEVDAVRATIDRIAGDTAALQAGIEKSRAPRNRRQS